MSSQSSNNNKPSSKPSSSSTTTSLLLTPQEKQSFQELISFCSPAQNNPTLRITALSHLLKFLKIKEYLSNLRFSIKLLEECIKSLVESLDDENHMISKLCISILILLSQDESTVFSNEMVRLDLIQKLMNVFISLTTSLDGTSLVDDDKTRLVKDRLECILLLLCNLTSSSEQARLKFLQMKTIEETLRKLKKANLKDSDSEDSDDSDSDSDSDDDSDTTKNGHEFNIMKLINYFNQPSQKLQISLISSHLIPTILGNLTVNDHAKAIIVNQTINNSNLSILHYLLSINNLNINLMDNLDLNIENDKCMRRFALLSILKNCLFKKNLIPNILYPNSSSDNNNGNFNLFNVLHYQLLSSNEFPNFIKKISIECLQLISDLPFGLEYLYPYLEKLMELKNIDDGLDEVIQAIQTRNLVKPGTLIRIDEETGEMINVNTFNSNDGDGNKKEEEKDFDELD